MRAQRGTPTQVAVRAGVPTHSKTLERGMWAYHARGVAESNSGDVAGCVLTMLFGGTGSTASAAARLREERSVPDAIFVINQLNAPPKGLVVVGGTLPFLKCLL